MLINGKEITSKEGITISEILKELEIEESMAVVEVDFEIIYKEQFRAKKLYSDSKVEVIGFREGGFI